MLVKSTATQADATLPGDFTLVDIQAPLGHVAHSSLRLLGAVGAEVVDVRRLVGDFKVADGAVALKQTESKISTSPFLFLVSDSLRCFVYVI